MDIKISKEYSIPLKLFDRGFVAFQKRHVYPRNMLMTAIALGISGVMMYGIFSGKTEGTSVLVNWVLIAVLISIVLNNWFSSFNVRKNLIKNIDGIQNDKFRLDVFEKYITINTIIPDKPEAKVVYDEEEKGNFDIFEGDSDTENFLETKLELTDKYFRFYEYADFFLLYQFKTMIYVVPKVNFSGEQIEIFKNILKNNSVKGKY